MYIKAQKIKSVTIVYGIQYRFKSTSKDWPETICLFKPSTFDRYSKIW